MAWDDILWEQINQRRRVNNFELTMKLEDSRRESIMDELKVLDTLRDRILSWSEALSNA